MKIKKKTKHTKHKKDINYKASGGREDEKQRRKYTKGGRIEAYTFGEAQKKKKDPIWG